MFKHTSNYTDDEEDQKDEKRGERGPHRMFRHQSLKRQRLKEKTAKFW